MEIRKGAHGWCMHSLCIWGMLKEFLRGTGQAVTRLQGRQSLTAFTKTPKVEVSVLPKSRRGRRVERDSCAAADEADTGHAGARLGLLMAERPLQVEVGRYYPLVPSEQDCVESLVT